MDSLPTLAGVVVGDANRAAYDACRTMCDEPRSAHRLLVLEGPSGTGKSFLLAALAGELRHVGQEPVVTFRGADLTDDAVAEAASSVLGRPPGTVLIDEVDDLPARLQLMSPLGALLDRLYLRGTRVVMACRRWTPELDAVLSPPAASGLSATRVQCLPVDLEIRRSIVARLSEATGAEAEADAVDLLARTSLPDAGHLVALAGTTLARARLKGLPVTAESVASALRHRGAQRRAGRGTTVHARRPCFVQPLAKHLRGVPATMPEPGPSTSLTTDVLAGFGALGRALSSVGPDQRLVLEERLDDERVQLARRAAIHAALAGRTVLLHTPHAAPEAVAHSLVALLSGVADPANTHHPPSLQRVVVRAELTLGASPLYLSDDPAVPIAHAGGIAREVRRKYGTPVDLVVTEGSALDRTLDACPLDVGAAFIASTAPAGLVTSARCDDRAWAFARHESRMWVRPMRGDWSEVEGPGAPVLGAHLHPLMRDETGAAVGWRLWEVRNGVDGVPSLLSPLRGTPWPRGVLTSTCATCGTCPTAGCTCGIYAHISPEDVVLTWRQHRDMVAGKVRAWGRVIRHVDGFRAQHVQIDTLYVPSSMARVGDELGRRYDCGIGPW